MSLLEAINPAPSGQSPSLDRVPVISPADLRAQALDGAEIAVVDVREGAAYPAGHISIAVELPLSELELVAPKLLPRKSLRIVVTDDDGGEAARLAAVRLTAAGYGDVRVLEGGLAAWRAAGFELITGEHALSKALGEFVERQYHTPRITAEELKDWIATREDLVILDTRPVPEYEYHAIPGGIAAPGAELLYRIYDQVQSPDTPVVINCAGRTRAIIGAQALKNAGFPNPVYSLENGTSAWILAGYEPSHGAANLAGGPSAEGLARATEAAGRVAETFGIRTLDAAGLQRFRDEADAHTLHLFDVRTAQEFEAGHLPGARWAAGGQLVQNLDRFVASLKARIVLTDDADLVRARITASWLIQLGLENVYVHAAAPQERTEQGAAATEVLNLPAEVDTLSPQELKSLLEAGAVPVIDLEPARPYWQERRAIPGALVARRSALAQRIGKLAPGGTVVLTSADGSIARLAAAELAGQDDRRIVALDGGTAAWIAAGFDAPAVGANQPALDPADALPQLPSLEQRRTRLDAYVRWGDDITSDLEKDGLVSFRAFDL